MKTNFQTIEEALKEGFRKVDRNCDTDVSGYNSFGYVFKDSQGNETIPVWFSDETNKLGRKGCVIPMFPPIVGK